MLARELVKISNFKEYYFIINKYDVWSRSLTYPETREIAFDYPLYPKTRGTGYGLLKLVRNENNNDLKDFDTYNWYYDIGYSLQLISNFKIDAERIATNIDKMKYADTNIKIFRIIRVEQHNGIAFIHLSMNRK